MNRYSCRIHHQPSKANCPECNPRMLFTDKELLAQRLVVFLESNHVRDYVSEKGYRMKVVTIVPPCSQEIPWHQVSSKEEAA